MSFDTVVRERCSSIAGERGCVAGGAAIGVMAATMPLEVVTRRMQVIT
jgi:hypothetical protein